MQFTITAILGLAAIAVAAPTPAPAAGAPEAQGYGASQFSCRKGQTSYCYPGEPRNGDTYNDVDVYSNCNQQTGLIPVSLCDNLNGNTIAVPVSLDLLSL